ncbi:hypothetical protein ACE1CD_14775 [Aerosakkonema sp. BLCC-F183]|uniref:hypothetical protein n=1 Tax=Aerosakkonema sp. BLCC-F183 TaxID=3342834 RepID=UPI0035B74435
MNFNQFGILNSQKFGNYLIALTSSIAVVFSSLINSAQAAESADFLFIVDESGSMSGEHTWLGGMIGSLDTALEVKGLHSNRYGLIGFGGGFYPGAPFARGLDMDLLTPGIQQFGTASMFANSTNQLKSSGGYEDGYQAIDYALKNYLLREDAALNVVLITDEDRDYTRLGSKDFDFNSILSALQSKNALLNAVVNFGFRDGNGKNAIGVNSHGNAFLADGLGGFTKSTGGAATTGFRTTKTDYIDLAWATGNSTIGGAAWNLNLLRAGGNSAISFTNAFVAVKAEEASQQNTTKVPEPSTGFGLLAFGTFSKMLLKRKNQKRLNSVRTN